MFEIILRIDIMKLTDSLAILQAMDTRRQPPAEVNCLQCAMPLLEYPWALSCFRASEKE